MKKEKPLSKVINRVGSMSELARRLGVSRAYVNDWEKGRKKIPATLVKKLVALSDGEVTAYDLRPDVFYDYEVEEKKELRMAGAWS